MILEAIDRLRHGPVTFTVHGVHGWRRVHADGFERAFVPPPPAPRYPCIRCGAEWNRKRDELCWTCKGDDRLTERQRLYLAAAKSAVEGIAHCDGRVLHPPGVCWACALDAYRPLHDLRRTMGIRYTGATEPAEFDPCPSEAYRPVETINRWGGNRATPA